MPPVEFRLSPGQRAVNAAWAIVVFALIAILRGFAFGIGVGIACFVVGIILSGVNYGLGALWALTLTPQGVTIKRYGTTVLAWNEIQSVVERNWMGTKQLKFIRYRGGAKISLAPMTHWLAKDPEFEQKLATIRQWHMQYAGGFSGPGVQQPGVQQSPYGQQQPYGQQAYPAQQSYGQQPQQPYAQQPQQNYQQQPYASPNPGGAQPPYGQPQPQQAYPYGAQPVPNQTAYPNAQQPGQQRW